MNALLVITLASTLALFGFVSETKKTKGQLPAYYSCLNGQPIDRSLFTPKGNEVYFVFNQDLNADTSDFNYINWYGVHDDFFTAYLVNTTDTTFHARRQDGSLVMIQEAKNEAGEWKPIEFWIPSGCGNSYFDPLELKPNEFAEVAIVRYSGRFKTQLRLKLQYSYKSKVMYSTPFEGSIDPSQFVLEKDQVNGILYYGKARYLDEE